MRILFIPSLLLLILSLSGCGNDPQAPAVTNLEKERDRWAAEGWAFVETFGPATENAAYAFHLSSETAKSITAIASTSGVRTNKIYHQTNAVYLLVSMQDPSGDTFALVFSKPK